MKKQQQETPYSRPTRRWHVPPPLVHGPDALEGAGVLDEVGGEAGLLLWQALRDVTLWAAAAPPERAELFGAHAGEARAAACAAVHTEADLADALDVFAQLLARPERVSTERVGQACRRVSQWADAQGAPAAALAFAQAAALACPGDAAASFRVAQLARRRAEHARAEAWFRRTVALARQSRDWVSYSLAFVGLGNLYAQRGNFPAARRLQLRGLRTAKRHRLHEIAGRAYHDLHVLATASEQPDKAEEYARAAFREYGPSHPRVPMLAHDVAFFWMTRGHFARALHVLEALLPHLRRPADRAAALANIVRAAGATGRDEEFESAWSEVWHLLQDPDAESAAAEAYLELARGAASRGDWDRAEAAAERALALAAARGESRIRLSAEQTLDAVSRHRSAERHAATAEHVPADAEADALAEDLVRCLTVAAG